VFQLDGGPMRSLLRLMAPTRFEDIAAVLALYRPGPMAANAHLHYAERKNGRQPIQPIHPELEAALEPILGTTYHLMVYQEQIMAVARSQRATPRQRRSAAPRDGQEEARDPGQGSPTSRPG
jgi:DNA polymerase-3 subunit alpha